jgi:threonine 3-dehydrogenase
MDLSPVITHELPLDDFATAFELVRSGRSGKVVLYPNGAESAA